MKANIDCEIVGVGDENERCVVEFQTGKGERFTIPMSEDEVRGFARHLFGNARITVELSEGS